MKPKRLAMGVVLATAAIVVSTPTQAGPPAASPELANQRLELFKNAQTSCAILILSNSEKGRALASLKKPLRDFCECVAVYAVSQTNDDAMSAIRAADAEQTSLFIDRQLKAFGVCSY